MDLQHGWENHPKTQEKSEFFLVLVLTESSELQGGNKTKPGGFQIHGCASGCRAGELSLEPWPGLCAHFASAKLISGAGSSKGSTLALTLPCAEPGWDGDVVSGQGRAPRPLLSGPGHSHPPVAPGDSDIPSPSLQGWAGGQGGQGMAIPVLEGMVCLVIQKLLLWVTRAGKRSPAQSKQGHAGV